MQGQSAKGEEITATATITTRPPLPPFTRDSAIQKIRKVDEEEKAEERRLQADKDKKEKRDTLLKNMSADEQRKYLEKEREKESRKAQKRRTMRA